MKANTSIQDWMDQAQLEIPTIVTMSLIPDCWK